jgi:hypothetical protein
MIAEVTWEKNKGAIMRAIQIANYQRIESTSMTTPEGIVIIIDVPRVNYEGIEDL